MEITRRRRSLCFMVIRLLFLTLFRGCCSSLSPSGVNYEVVALISIKRGLYDPYNALVSWDVNSVDPCSWRMITCTPDGFVYSLEVPSLSLSGSLSPGIGNLTNLQSVLLQNNEIAGPIPDALGKLEKLQTLDLSNNKLTGEIPSSLGDLMNLNYLRLNNNSLSGPLPESLSNIKSLSLLDLSFNGLSGSIPNVSARTFIIDGNPLICGQNELNNCFIGNRFSTPDSMKRSGGKHQVIIAAGVSSGCGIMIIMLVCFLLWWKQRPNKQISSMINDHLDLEINLGQVRRYTFRELKAATDNFNPKNILGRGGSGVVYKGWLNSGEVIAVKCLNDYNAVGSEIQFQTEVKLISLAVHRNLLRLWGFCSAENERILVYPYMPNGSVASRLKDNVDGRPVLGWTKRKRVAVGTARGLAYLHEQCDPKVIHRDVKAANILLDEEFEAVVGDFGLAKLLDHRDTHVTTAVRGTVGHIAPEYLSTGQSSEKTDVYGFGILLLELITGQKAVEFVRQANHKGAVLDLVKKLHDEGELGMMADGNLMNEYNAAELEQMARVALLCTQANPANRPSMSEALRMLEGDGCTDRWEKPIDVEATTSDSSESHAPPLFYPDYAEVSSYIVEAMDLSGPR